jgi:hypothetical protein
MLYLLSRFQVAVFRRGSTPESPLKIGSVCRCSATPFEGEQELPSYDSDSSTAMQKKVEAGEGHQLLGLMGNIVSHAHAMGTTSLSPSICMQR